jgi:hypothetical protein
VTDSIPLIAVDDAVQDDLGGFAHVEVTERVGGATTYRLRYDLDIEGGDLPRLADGRFDPGATLSVLVPTDAGTECLVKGPVTGQRAHLAHGGEGSWLEVEGADSTVEMDRETKTRVWADVTDRDAIESVLNEYGYAALDVESTPALHAEDKHALVQRESDLGLVRRLARRNGFHFWVSCSDGGDETAHCRRPALDASPAAAVVINLEGPNTAALDLRWDAERPTSVVGSQLDLNGLNDLDGSVPASPLAALGDQSLADVAGGTRSVHLAAPADDAGDLQARGEAALIEAGWFVEAQCETSLNALRAIVRAHSVVEVRGAGSRHSGPYFVAGVRHRADRTAHTMHLTLWRNAWSGGGGLSIPSLV